MSITRMASDADLLIKESVVDIKKSFLKKNILRELYGSGPCTIAQLTKLLHTSVPSVTTLIEELINEQWVVETGIGAAQYGRKPALFALNPVGHNVLVLDINTHESKLAVINLRHEVVARRTVDLPLEDSAAFLKKLQQLADDFLEETGLSQRDFVAVGVSIPGLVDPQTGMNYTYRNLNAPDHSLGEWFEANFQLPVFAINDTKATILGEHRFGLAKGKDHVLSVNIDWGVGLGVILNGEVFQGASGFAGELGHIQVKPDGVLCKCGKIGCLDTVASASALIRRAKHDLANGQASKLAELAKQSAEMDVEKVIEAAKQGDVYAIDLLNDIGTELGKGLAIAVHLFNPEIIIVGGVLATAERFITNPLEQAINKYCLMDFKNKLKVEISHLGEKARLYGTQTYVIERYVDVTEPGLRW